MSYMRAQKLANYPIWHEIPKSSKNRKNKNKKTKKKNKQTKKTQHATGDQDGKSKTRIFLQIPFFF